MNNKAETLGDRLRRLRGKKTLLEVAQLVPCPITTLQRYEKGRIPDAEFACRIASIYEVSVEYLVTGKEREAPAAPPISTTVIAEIDGGDSDKKSRQAQKNETAVTLRSIPVLEDKIAAGPGSVVNFAKIENYAFIPSSRLNRHHQYYLLRITGDSMEPELKRNDLILVNLGKHDPRELKDKIVAAYLPDEDGATVKRLREDTSGKFWILQPCNPSHRERVVAKKDEGVRFAAVEGAWKNFE